MELYDYVIVQPSERDFLIVDLRTTKQDKTLNDFIVYFERDHFIYFSLVI